jgi:hypothetical protein
MAITRIKIEREGGGGGGGEREREGQSMAMLGIFKASWLKILYAYFTGMKQTTSSLRLGGPNKIVLLSFNMVCFDYFNVVWAMFIN